jgi:hypothetical protein
VHAFPSHAGGGGAEQLPLTQVEPLAQSASVQQAEAQAQVLPCFT